jgi:hypothetical protein
MCYLLAVGQKIRKLKVDKSEAKNDSEAKSQLITNYCLLSFLRPRHGDYRFLFVIFNS